MKHIIDGILAMRIVVQFIAQALGVVLLRKKKGTRHLPYKMPLYPLPVIAVIGIWLYIFFSTEWEVMVYFLAVFSAGLIVYFIYAYLNKRWPFNEAIPHEVQKL
jgi:amino acid transporter